MADWYQLLDVNFNRCAEGLRILEDCTRYEKDFEDIALRVKQLRQHLRTAAKPLENKMLAARKAGEDPGPKLSQQVVPKDTTPRDGITVNFKRVQEALRALEEYHKLIGRGETAQTIEKMRFEAYQLEQMWTQKSLKYKRLHGLDTDIYGITGEVWSLGRPNVDVVQAMVDSGIKIIQYREKEKSMLEKYRECEALRKITQDAGALFIINDHADLAVAVDADGVHVGQDDIPPEQVRHFIGPNRLLGLSTHNPVQAENAVKSGVDYIGVGPLYKTYTKKDVCDPVGLTYLDHVVQNVQTPFVAIGGIKKHNLKTVIRRGAKCVCLVTEIVGAQDIAGCVKEIRTIIREGKHESV